MIKNFSTKTPTENLFRLNRLGGKSSFQVETKSINLTQQLDGKN